MKKRLYGGDLSGSCCGDPGRSRHLDLSKKSRTFVPATEVLLKGPYGTLTLQLPEEWNYEIQTEEQDTVYGISFYRGEDKENEVLVKYEKDYPGETCGTGLEEKKIRLAGEKPWKN